MRYKLIAIDLDGTLLNRDHSVSAANVRAIARAREAGATVVVCTGRGLVESRQAIDAIGQTEPVIVAGGSIIADPTNGSTLHRFPMDRGIVRDASELLLGHGFPVLVLKDSSAVGYDYLVIEGDERHPLDPITLWWFGKMDVTWRTAASLDDDEHPEHTVRFGVCGRASELSVVRSRVHERFGERVMVMHFPAVVAPGATLGGAVGSSAGQMRIDEEIDIFEVFDRRANKWSALSYLAGELGVEPNAIAAIGDQVNDVEMIQHAALGVAMGNATEQIKGLANVTTASNAEDGVAVAIERMLDGSW